MSVYKTKNYNFINFLIFNIGTILLFHFPTNASQPHVTTPSTNTPTTQTSTSYIDMANSSAKSGQYDQSLSYLNKAISQDPNNARAYKLRGHVFYAKGDYQRALTDLNHVVSLIPSSANAYADRAIVYSILGHHGLALADIERALALKPDSSFAKAVRTKILERAVE